MPTDDDRIDQQHELLNGIIGNARAIAKGLPEQGAEPERIGAEKIGEAARQLKSILATSGMCTHPDDVPQRVWWCRSCPGLVAHYGGSPGKPPPRCPECHESNFMAEPFIPADQAQEALVEFAKAERVRIELTEKLDEVSAERATLKTFARTVANDYDCDRGEADAHPLWCRSCEAEKLARGEG